MPILTWTKFCRLDKWAKTGLGSLGSGYVCEPRWGLIGWTSESWPVLSLSSFRILWAKLIFRRLDKWAKVWFGSFSSSSQNEFLKKKSRQNCLKYHAFLAYFSTNYTFKCRIFFLTILGEDWKFKSRTVYIKVTVFSISYLVFHTLFSCLFAWKHKFFQRKHTHLYHPSLLRFSGKNVITKLLAYRQPWCKQEKEVWNLIFCFASIVPRSQTIFVIFREKKEYNEKRIV